MATSYSKGTAKPTYVDFLIISATIQACQPTSMTLFLSREPHLSGL